MGVKVTPPSPEQLALLGNLTGRQRQVARLLAQGMTHKDVGEVLGIHHMTVKNHVSDINRKTNARNTIHIMRLVIWDEALKFLEKRTRGCPS